MSDLQSLFAALTEERDRLRAETGAADAARSAAERSVLSLRSEQAALAQRLQPARASLGNASRQMELLRARAAGLGGQIRAEGAEVRRLAGALAELEADGTAARRASVEELEALGGELEHAMDQHDEGRIARELTAAAVSLVVLPRLAKADADADADADAEAGAGAGAGAGEAVRALSARIEQSLGVLRREEARCASADDVRSALRGTVADLRAAMMRGSNRDGRVSLDGPQRSIPSIADRAPFLSRPTS